MPKTQHDSETAAKGQQVITVCAFIYKKENGEIYLFSPKRAATKKFLPGVYELPGGHIDYGEDLVQGLKREIKEEFNMDIKVGDCFYAFTYLNKVKGSHSVEILFFAQFTSPETQLKLDPEDHSEFKWMSRQDYEKLRGEKNDPEYKAVIKGFEILMR
jgi:8-oxo-dGTP pyrophosphatase MutT (NUDIX family)